MGCAEALAVPRGGRWDPGGGSLISDESRWNVNNETHIYSVRLILAQLGND